MSPAILSRLLDEKLGFFSTVAGRFAEAEAWYDSALEKSQGDSRGEVKVALGRELVRYLRALHEGTSTSPSIEASLEFAGSPKLVKAQDVEETLHVNPPRCEQAPDTCCRTRTRDRRR